MLRESSLSLTLTIQTLLRTISTASVVRAVTRHLGHRTLSSRRATVVKPRIL
ncbi:unnamed protein product [Timema podura]|uniref:Uncharacterized protein n=1 Tax=Timema podura TaxID=61482 RepID=A0ABN7PG78_TIMPD|nr:unnamed protein product [Timema podura]